MSVHIAACPQLCMLFIEIGHTCSAGSGLVWMFAGLADALALRGTLHNFFAMTWLLHSHIVLKPVIQKSHLSMPSSHRVSCDRTYRITDTHGQRQTKTGHTFSNTYYLTEKIVVVVQSYVDGHATNDENYYDDEYVDDAWCIAFFFVFVLSAEENLY